MLYGESSGASEMEVMRNKAKLLTKELRVTAVVCKWCFWL